MMCFINFSKRVAFEIFHQNQDCILISLRLSDPDERAILIEEANLCVTSCLRILKSVTVSCSDFDLVLECLKSIEACVSLLEDRVMLDKDRVMLDKVEKMNHVVEESFQVSIKWCNEHLNKNKFPCYIIDDSERELQVCICCLLTVLLVKESLLTTSSFIITVARALDSCVYEPVQIPLQPPTVIIVLGASIFSSCNQSYHSFVVLTLL